MAAERSLVVVTQHFADLLDVKVVSAMQQHFGFLYQVGPDPVFRAASCLLLDKIAEVFGGQAEQTRIKADGMMLSMMFNDSLVESGADSLGGEFIDFLVLLPEIIRHLQQDIQQGNHQRNARGNIAAIHRSHGVDNVHHIRVLAVGQMERRILFVAETVAEGDPRAEVIVGLFGDHHQGRAVVLRRALRPNHLIRIDNGDVV